MKINITKRILFGLALFLGLSNADAQTGLQNVIVERYYVSDADDSLASVGVLPVGSVTYRVFVDMKAGYKFQSAYGSPTHSLLIKTTSSFFNNEDRGSVTPAFTKSQAKFNTIMLDSWLSAGAVCTGNFGILKSEDNGVSTIVNADGILVNDDPMAGIPLTIQDGFIAGTPGSYASIGIDNELGVFDATSQAGNSFVTNNGAWSCISGAVGPDTTNKVLIAQITTEGELTFELNIQIGKPDGGTEQFVAKDPTGNETQLNSLTYNSVFAGLAQPIVQNNTNTDKVSVFPNPSNGAFSLQIISDSYNAENHYTIYTIVGAVILRKRIKNGSGDFIDKIDLSAYPNGMYLIEVLLNGHKSIRKLIKN
ncbi:MAG: T9SS type A sorting domain-containing protein [Paludibacter sp.]